MKNAWNKCLAIMGKQPCEHTVLGLGSIARYEITPFSDFEHAIVLDNIPYGKQYEKCLEYFRFVALLFQIVLLNQGETVIRFLGVTHLNNYIDKNDWFYDAFTPCGVSADSMVPFASKFPLGRLMTTRKKPFLTELIKCVDEMIKYLDSDVTIKEDYHLSDILLQVSFIAGDQSVFDYYVEKVHSHLL